MRQRQFDLHGGALPADGGSFRSKRCRRCVLKIESHPASPIESFALVVLMLPVPLIF